VAAEIGGDTRDVQAIPAESRDSQGHNRQPVDNCESCAVMTLAATAMVSSPPVLLLPQALEFLYLATDAEFLHLKFVGVPFQPRTAPAS
jgi:hypothetical protein